MHQLNSLMPLHEGATANQTYKIPYRSPFKVFPFSLTLALSTESIQKKSGVFFVLFFFSIFCSPKFTPVLHVRLEELKLPTLNIWATEQVFGTCCFCAPHNGIQKSSHFVFNKMGNKTVRSKKNAVGKLLLSSNGKRKWFTDLAENPVDVWNDFARRRVSGFTQAEGWDRLGKKCAVDIFASSAALNVGRIVGTILIDSKYMC